VSRLSEFLGSYEDATADGSLSGDGGLFDTRNAGRQAVRAANDNGLDANYYDIASGLPSGADGWEVGPGGAAVANEKPGVQSGETIELTRNEGGQHVETITRTLPADVSGFVRLGDVFSDLPAGAQDLVLYVEPSANYSPDTAGDELAAGTEGTAGDVLADAASQATNGASNDGEGIVDSSGGVLDVDTASAGVVGVLVLLAAVALGWSS
jgi:hypothetical protein